MMKIKLNLKNNYALVPEGERVLTITKAECSPSGKPNKMKVTLQDSEGGFVNSNYDFTNDKALFAMGKFLETALEFQDGDEFDTVSDCKRLINVQLLCEVAHTEGKTPNENGELPKFANLKRVIEKVGETAQTTQTTQTTTTNTTTTTQVETNVVESPRNSISTYDI